MTVRFRSLRFIAFAAVLFSSPALPQDAPSEVSLLIGNANYLDAGSPLLATLNETRTLAEEFRRNNFEVYSRENLAGSAMRRAIDAFMGRIRSGSTALFYFNGYGIQVGRQTFLLPIDAQISTEATVRKEGINLDATVAEMHRRGAKAQIVIVDAARRNPYETRFRTSPAGLAPLEMPEGTLALYAAAPGKIVSSGGSSLLVTELIKELRVPGRTTEEIFNRTRTAVLRATNNEQAPWVATSLVEQFYLGQGRRTNPAASPAASSTTPAPNAPASPTPSRPPVVAAAPADSEDQVRRDYQFSEIVGTKKGWDDFLAQHPSGRYSDLARDKAAKFSPAAGTDRPGSSAIFSKPSDMPKASARTVDGADDSAIEDLDQRIRQTPGDYNAYYKRGQLYAQRGSYRRAIEDFDVVLRQNSKDAEALSKRCWALAVLDDFKAALSDCNEAIKLRPRYPDAFDGRGFINLKQGKSKQAVRDYDVALQGDSKRAASLYGRGLAKIRIGDTKSGDNDIAAAKSIRPGIADEFASYGVR